MMKQILVALALLPVVTHANELSAGTFELAGGTSLGFRSGSSEVKNGSTTDHTDYGVSTTGLYHVTPNVGLGISLSYSHSKVTVGALDSTSAQTFVGPAVGLDFPAAPQLSVFARGTVGVARAKFTDTGDPDMTPSGTGFALAAGIKYFPVPSVSFDVGLGYDWVRLSEDQREVTTSGLGADLGLSVYFGGR